MRKINPYSVLFQSNLFYIFTTLIITTLLILLPQKKSFSQVPDIEWQKSFGGSSTDEVKCIIQTKDGGYIFAGWTHSNDFDVIGSYGQVTADCWIVKTDPLGNIQWQRVIGGTQDDIALSIKQTLDGGYIIGGHSSSGDGDLTKNYGNSMDALVIKLDPQGNIEWLKNLGGNEYDVIISIELTSDGGFICAGYTGSNTIDVSGLHGDYDAWIVKLDQDGDIQWQKCIGGKERDVAWSIKQTTDGGYVFTGHTRSSDGDILINQGGFDIFVCKLNAAGNIEWLKTIGGSANDWGLDINCTPDGGYIIAGYTFSGNGDVTTNFGMNDIWIIKLNEAGNIQWQKSYGGSDYDDPYSIELTTDGGYVVAGRTRSADGDVTLNNGDNDYWVLKLDVNGALQWQKTVGGSEQEVAHSIKQTLDGGFIIAGASLSDNGDVTYNRGISDIWVVKLGDCKLKTPDIPGKITGNISPCIGTLVTYSINAVNEATGYTWSFPIGWDIFSGQGTSQITVTAGTTSGNINVFAYNSCKSSDNQTITVTPVTEQPPQIVIAANSGNEICEGTLVVFTAQTSGATSPVYQWKKNGISVGQNSSIYNDNNLANGDIISCQLKSISICEGHFVVVSPIITMLVSPLVTPTITISSNATSICAGADVQFISTSSNQGTNPTYNWSVNNISTGTNQPTFNINSLSDGDIISCKLISNQGCLSSPSVMSNNITINVNTSTTASVTITSSSTLICKNDEVTFNALAVNAGTAPTYNWFINGVAEGNNNAILVTTNLSDKDEIFCKVIPGANTCATNTIVSNKINITINLLPQIIIHPGDTMVKPASQVNFSTFISEDIHSFEWLPESMLLNASSLNPTTVPILEPVQFQLKVITKDGCSINKIFTIKPLFPIYIPNAFTPNRDGINDLFRIPPNADFVLEVLNIYNRWGEKIYSTKNINEGWNGLFKDMDQPAGVYIYEIYGFHQNKFHKFKGTFTLIR